MFNLTRTTATTDICTSTSIENRLFPPERRFPLGDVDISVRLTKGGKGLINYFTSRIRLRKDRVKITFLEGIYFFKFLSCFIFATR